MKYLTLKPAEQKLCPRILRDSFHENIHFRQSDYFASIKGRLSVTLTSYVQSLALLAFADVVGNLALYSRVVQLASSVVNNHLRRVIPDHLFLVDKPSEKKEAECMSRSSKKLSLK